MDLKIEDQLILFVKNHPELYNRKLNEYAKNRDDKLIIFEKFGQSLVPPVDGETLLKKWTCLNNQYLRELRIPTLKSGKPKKVWPRFNQLDEFLNVNKTAINSIDEDTIDFNNNRSKTNLINKDASLNENNKRTQATTSDKRIKSNDDFFEKINNLFENITKSKVMMPSIESNQNKNTKDSIPLEDDHIHLWLMSLKNDLKLLYNKNQSKFNKFKLETQIKIYKYLEEGDDNFLTDNI